MTTEAQQVGSWPRIGRYIAFVVLASVAPFALIALVIGLSSGLQGIVPDELMADVAGLVVLWGLYVLLPVTVLAVFPGLALFRFLARRLRRRGWPPLPISALSSAAVFAFGCLGIGFAYAIAEGSVTLRGLLWVSGAFAVMLVPAAAMIGGLLLQRPGLQRPVLQRPGGAP